MLRHIHIYICIILLVIVFFLPYRFTVNGLCPVKMGTCLAKSNWRGVLYFLNCWETKKGQLTFACQTTPLQTRPKKEKLKSPSRTWRMQQKTLENGGCRCITQACEWCRFKNRSECLKWRWLSCWFCYKDFWVSWHVRDRFIAYLSVLILHSNRDGFVEVILLWEYKEL